MDNISQMTMLVLAGFNGTANYRVTLLALTFLCYCVILLVNLTIILTIIVDKSLHEPMYIFLCNLCINGLYGTAGFYPKFLNDLLFSTQVISQAGCLVQAFVLHSSASADSSFLALMAYDRYVAICRPLVYRSVMTKQRICTFVIIAWMVPHHLVLLSTVTSISRLCGSIIPKIYCVNILLINLACSPSIAKTIVPAVNSSIFTGHAAFVVWTYIQMIKTCLKSRENMNKFIQTCVPHVFALTIFTISLLFDLLYTLFGSKNLPQHAQNFLAIEFLIFPQIINPLIYGLKLTKIRNRILFVLKVLKPKDILKLNQPQQI
ncbi:olfactory receptor 52I2-like [Betta splendens]|uniref:Olfactory receptor 52I2-like n=1 Tax=Betta splendens TaxID=158456 RepID=A0A6P7LCL3_BETSP|nr:olfactory receptor 52I2-like [Betta splendens]